MIESLIGAIFVAGLGLGFIACQIFVVRKLVNEILTMRMAGFDPRPRLYQKVDSALESDPQLSNET